MEDIGGGINALFGTMKMITQPTAYEASRKAAFTDKIGEVVVDTVCPIDTGRWETGIKVGAWIIVEQYSGEEAAKAGHEKWVQKVRAGERDFKSIQDSGEFEW